MRREYFPDALYMKCHHIFNTVQPVLWLRSCHQIVQPRPATLWDLLCSSAIQPGLRPTSSLWWNNENDLKWWYNHSAMSSSWVLGSPYAYNLTIQSLYNQLLDLPQLCKMRTLAVCTPLSWPGRVIQDCGMASAYMSPPTNYAPRCFSPRPPWPNE